MDLKAGNIYCLVLYRKKLSIPNIDHLQALKRKRKNKEVFMYFYLASSSIYVVK